MTDRSNDVRACETHLSEVFLGSDRVYKRLKAVHMPFVDLRSCSARCAAATEEYERNHAISPNVYLGTADVIEDGTLAERLIVMRRLRDEHQLSQNLNGPCADANLVSAARRIALLHAGSTPLFDDRTDFAAFGAVGQNWRDNFDTIESVAEGAIDPEEFTAVRALVESWLSGREALFNERIAAGWIRDGHGDLRAEHVYNTPSGVELIDCLAFADSLRISDVLADIAFLAMDVERLAGPGPAAELMRSWGEFTGEHHPPSLAHFYVAYRAHVRCKVAALRHQQSSQPKDAHEARAYHAMALRHLELARINVVLVGGGPGTGKSTVAERVASKLGAAWIRMDEVRKDVAKVSHSEHAFAAPDQGIYTPEITQRTFDEVMRRSQLLLERGISVVLDATWRTAEHRTEARALASRCSAQLTELQCVLDPATAKERIARRMASMYEPSDATPDLVDFMKARFDPWPEAATVDTAGSVESSVAQAFRLIPGLTQDVRNEQEAERFPDQVSRLREWILLAGGLPPAPAIASAFDPRRIR